MFSDSTILYKQYIFSVNELHMILQPLLP